MEQFGAEFMASLTSLPSLIVYLAAGGWLLIESVGVGLPIEPVLLLVGAVSIRPDPLQTAIHLAAGLGALVAGTLLGALFGFAVGRRAGRGLPRVGRAIGLTDVRIEHLSLWLRKRGALGVFLSRFIPVVRGLAPYVLGASHIPFPVFLIGSALGAVVYEGLWVGLGAFLGKNYQVPLQYLNQFGTPGLIFVVVVIILLIVIHYLSAHLSWRRLSAHFHRHMRSQPGTLPES